MMMVPMKEQGGLGELEATMMALIADWSAGTLLQRLGGD